MSQEDVEAFKRAVDAWNRRDVEAMLRESDPEIEYYAVLPGLGAEARVYRGHDAVREFLREVDEVLDEIHTEYTEVRDLGDRLVAFGHMRARGKGSKVPAETPIGTVIDIKDHKALRIRNYLDPKEALEAAGLSE